MIKSIDEYLARTVKLNDIPYIKQALKEWLTQKREYYNKKLGLPYMHRVDQLDELLEELRK